MICVVNVEALTGSDLGNILIRDPEIGPKLRGRGLTEGSLN